LGESSVDGQLDSCDAATVVRCQKYDGFGDLNDPTLRSSIPSNGFADQRWLDKSDLSKCRRALGEFASGCGHQLQFHRRIKPYDHRVLSAVRNIPHIRLCGLSPQEATASPTNTSGANRAIPSRHTACDAAAPVISKIIPAYAHSFNRGKRGASSAGTASNFQTPRRGKI
jgi:hypothetical protein